MLWYTSQALVDIEATICAHISVCGNSWFYHLIVDHRIGLAQVGTYVPFQRAQRVRNNLLEFKKLTRTKQFVWSECLEQVARDSRASKLDRLIKVHTQLYIRTSIQPFVVSVWRNLAHSTKVSQAHTPWVFQVWQWLGPVLEGCNMHPCFAIQDNPPGSTTQDGSTRTWAHVQVQW